MAFKVVSYVSFGQTEVGLPGYSAASAGASLKLHIDLVYPRITSS